MLLPLAAVKELAAVSCAWVANTVVVMWYCRIFVSSAGLVKSCEGVKLRVFRAAVKACRGPGAGGGSAGAGRGEGQVVVRGRWW